MVRLRALWIFIKASYWFWPALLSIAAVLGSVATVAIDRAGLGGEIASRFWAAPMEPQTARNILNVIAASMLGVTATVFSITIAAVVYASGSYGPRLLNNFMEDRGNQLSLGMFIGTFTYALMVLRVLRGDGADGTNAVSASVFVPQFSVMFALVLMAGAVVVLVYFLHHIPASIRINTVLEVIGERLLHDVRKRFPGLGEEDDEEPWPAGQPVYAHRCGYIQLVDFAGLDRIAREHGCRLALRLRTGDFVQPGMPVVGVIGREPDEALAREVQGCFSLGGMRTAEQDPEFLIDELVEIILRALSPSMNDPFTALTSLYWLSAATTELAARSLGAGPDGGDYDRERVRPVGDDFPHFLRRGIAAVRHDVAANPMVADQFLECLTAVAAQACSEHRRRLVLHEGDLLLEQCRHRLAGPALDGIIARHARFQSDVEQLLLGERGIDADCKAPQSR